MQTFLIALLLLPGVCFVLVLAIVRAVTAADLEEVVRAARRRSVVATVVTVAVGVLALWAWTETQSISLAIRLATMPALVGTVTVLAASVAELTWPRPQGQVRRASLTARRGADAPRLRWALAATTVVTAAALVTGAFTAGSDGRSLELQWADRAAGHGPYPGWPYVVPMGLACIALLLVTALGLALVARRPALGVGHEAADRILRHASAVRVLRGAVFGMAATAAGLLFVMGGAVFGITGPDAYPSQGLHAVGVAGMVLGLLCGVVAVAAAVWPTPRVPAEAVTPSTSATTASA